MTGEAYVRLPADSVGKKLSTWEKTNHSGDVVEEQVVQAVSIIQKFRDDFGQAVIDPANWQVLQQDAGTTLSLAASVLTLGSGTTNGSQLIIRSLKKFTIPFRIQVGLMLSNRRANQAFSVEVVKADGTVVARWYWDGTVATSTKYQSADDNGNAIALTAVTTLTSASLAVFEIDLRDDTMYFRDRTANSKSEATTRNVQQDQLPDPEGIYYVQFRWQNTGVPAGNSNALISWIHVLDEHEVTVEVSAGRGQGSIAESLPVSVQNTPLIVPNSSTTAWIGGRHLGIHWDDTSATLASGATFTGTGRDVFGAASGTAATLLGRLIEVVAASDVAGTLYIDQSPDNATWYQTDTVAVAGSAATPKVAQKLEAPIIMRYFRVRYINGGTGQASFQLSSAMVR